MEYEYSEDEFLQLSGIQHFLFCRRQWALIHIEQQWNENFHTADGRVMHMKVHDPSSHTKRGDLLIIRAMKVHSSRFGISGECDVVEFHRGDQGIHLTGHDGMWKPFPVEYKRGRKKSGLFDEAQLCAQAMCLEEMLCCSVKQGALFYGEERHRQNVIFTEELRDVVAKAITEMHALMKQGYTPRVKKSKSCSVCSLKDVCVPELTKAETVDRYIRQAMED